MRVVAEEEGVALAAGPMNDSRLVTDPRLIRRVLYNLLDNAIKYTNPGGRVAVASAADGTHLTVTVSDTGIGIPAEHLSRVFERFYRADPARAGDRQGAGLGLARSAGPSFALSAVRSPSTGRRGPARRPVSSCRSCLPTAWEIEGPRRKTGREPAFPSYAKIAFTSRPAKSVNRHRGPVAQGRVRDSGC